MSPTDAAKAGARLLAARRGAQMKDALDRLIDEAIAARRSAAALSARQQRELAITQ